MAAVSTRSSSRRVGLPLPSTSRQPPKAWARCDVHHSLLPPAARRGRTVDYTRGWISSASKPPRCAACATMALRLGNAMVIRQPTHGHATCARRATTSSIMTQTVSSCAKITTCGHTSGDTFVMAKAGSVVARCGFGRCPSPSGLFASAPPPAFGRHHTAHGTGHDALQRRGQTVTGDIFAAAANSSRQHAFDCTRLKWGRSQSTERASPNGT